MKEVSIIIPTFNSARFLERAIRSCAVQSVPREKYDIIVVDDGSTDCTSLILDKYSDDIKICRLPENRGLPTALNHGLKTSKSRYFVRVDADDYVHEDYVRILLLFLNTNHHHNSVACDYTVVDKNEEKVERMSWEKTPIGCCVMYRMDAACNVGLYDPTFKMAEEIDFHKRYIAKYGKTPVIEIPLYRYYRHENNMTNDQQMYDEFKRKISR